MRRVVSVFLPTWPTDRLRRAGVAPPDGPLVTALPIAGQRVIGGASAEAHALGLRSGQPVASAQARVQGLMVRDATPVSDIAALSRLAGWALRFAPLTAPDQPDGLWLETAGCDHLWGGEAAMLDAICDRLAAAGIAARAAVASTPGTAHALARYGERPRTVVDGSLLRALHGLPLAALRIPAATVMALERVGLERVGQLAGMPRASLARRYGLDLLRRLDQALGDVPEPITPLPAQMAIAAREAFSEPLLTAPAFAAVIARLVARACDALERAGQGARQLDVRFVRVDSSHAAIRVGTARPARSPTHLTRLLVERLESVDPGLGVEAMELTVALAERLAPAQQDSGGHSEAPHVPQLVDRLIGRLGAAAVYRMCPVESRRPERSVARIPPLAAPTRAMWPIELPRPVRLLDPPQPVEAIALLPDHPPAQFTWRRVVHRIRRADGPERVRGEWWRARRDTDVVRDYFAVEDEAGRRYWLFRRGDGVDPATGDTSWHLHGVG